ncbi:MAG: gamma-glutamylcyclotransferase, partial [Comamonas sp.]|nr:gamma-glutamylcyclotransferase [Comamonas sp.]
GTTLDYAQATFEELQRLGIDDKALKRLLAYADFQQSDCLSFSAI